MRLLPIPGISSAPAGRSPSPLAVKGMGCQMERRHLLIRHLPLGRIHAGIPFGVNRQPGAGGRPPNQRDDHRMTDQRPPPPVQADVREQALFDL